MYSVVPGWNEKKNNNRNPFTGVVGGDPRRVVVVKLEDKNIIYKIIICR